MAEQDQAHAHGYPAQKELRSHGDVPHELRRVSLNAADRKTFEDLPMVGPKQAQAIAARPFKTCEDLVRSRE